VGVRVQNRGKRNLFLNFLKFRTSGLLTPPPPSPPYVRVCPDFPNPPPPPLSARTSFVNGPLPDEMLMRSDSKFEVNRKLHARDVGLLPIYTLIGRWQ
jgi:hypothetical protein